MPSFPVEESATAVADANGRAVVRLGPSRAMEKWSITNTAVQSTSVDTATFKLYRGSESTSRFIEGTYAGGQDNSNTAYTLQNGEPAVGVWTGATIGATCTMTISGTGER